MPFVLLHKQSSEIYTCPLINLYNFPYYGTKAWEDRDEAENEYSAFLSERGTAPVSDWDLFELEEHKLKLCNVKLNNNPKKRLFWRNGTIETQLLT